MSTYSKSLLQNIWEKVIAKILAGLFLILVILTRLGEFINEHSGRIVSWLTTILVLIMCYDVLMRYAFQNTSVWIVELEWHLFALIFLIGAAYTLKHDAHVRVDVFYAKRSPRTQAIINFVGTVVFLIPLSIIVIKTSYNFAYNSFLINESSADPGGLPARYLIKGSITVGFILLLMQAIAEATKSLVHIIGLERMKLFMARHFPMIYKLRIPN
jgi:TRAP-type mannitol/chloroaromatic compound transport system permease small subunit